MSRTKAVALRFEEVEKRLLLAVDAEPQPATAAAPPPLIAGSTSETVSASASDPGQVKNVTDPRIIKEGETYYVFSTGPGIPIRASDDLTHWRAVGQVFATTPSWAMARVPGATSIWAPDISYFNGEYHLYYAVSTFGGQRSVIGLATNTVLDPSAPGYQWVDRGAVIASRPGRTNYNAIDPNLAIDPSSGVWLAFGSQWSGIKLVAIDPSTGKPRGRAPRLHALASRPGGAPIEAAFLLKKEDYWYLFMSFDRCCMGVNSTYRIMVGRSRSITGPYLDRDGRPLTQGGGTLVLGSDARYRGPGHNAVLSDGGRDDLVYHTYDVRNAGVPSLQIRPLAWTSDGWPVAGAPLY